MLDGPSGRATEPHALGAGTGASLGGVRRASARATASRAVPLMLQFYAPDRALATATLEAMNWKAGLSKSKLEFTVVP